MSNALVRSTSDKMIAGVCGGLARQFNIDANLLRILFVVFGLFSQAGILIYAALWLFLPTDAGGPNGLTSLKHQFGSNRN
ncbi:MAG: PspC domain-containing protein [Propionibacteriaceae bacterium]|nr:PspC domain-containing protein [Propionibacteriaceae bacterium]